MDAVRDLLPVVIGAVVAGISALVKSAYERRDQRLTAARQLELATKRTEFVSSWLQVARTFDDEGFLVDANVKAQAELVEAYEDAQHALADGRSAAGRSSLSMLADQLQSVLLLEHRRHWLSYVLTGVFWASVTILWLALPEMIGDGPDELAAWEAVLTVAFITGLLRFLVGALVSWVERRVGSPLAAPTADSRAPVDGVPAAAPLASVPFTSAATTEPRA